MGYRIEDKTNFTLCVLSGDCKSTAAPNLGKELAKWVRDDPLNLIWDFTALTAIDATNFGAIAGSMVVQLVRRHPNIVIRPNALTRSYLSAAGLKARVVVAHSIADAVAKLIMRIPKRYDRFFFDILVREGYVSDAELSTIVKQSKRRDAREDIGLALVQQAILTPQQLLACIALQKSRLGEILLDSGLISRQKLDFALEAQSGGRKPERLGDVLLRLSIASNAEIYQALTRQAKRRRQLGVHYAPAPPSSPEKSNALLLGEILVESNVLDQAQLQVAVNRQSHVDGPGRLGQILCELGFVNNSDLYNALLTQFKRKDTFKHLAEHTSDVRTAFDEILARLNTDDYLKVHRVRRALLPMGQPGQDALVSALSNPERLVRRNAARLLGDIGGIKASASLIKSLSDPDRLVVDAAGWSLTRISRKLISYTKKAEWENLFTKFAKEAHQEETPVLNNSLRELEPTLEKMAEGTEALDDLFIEYCVGIPDWYGGRTTMTICGDGMVLASNLYKEEWRMLDGRMRPRDIRTLLGLLLDTATLHIRTDRDIGATDESLHEIAVGIHRHHRCTTFLWYREIYKNPAFARFERGLRFILREATYGQFW